MDTRASGVPEEYVLSAHPQDRIEGPGPSSRPPLIDGLVEALLEMKPGEARKLFVPAKLAYGREGFKLLVPANADLVFEVELVSFQPPAGR